MTDASRRLGIAYGRLGLATDPDLIARRVAGVGAVAGNLEQASLAPLVQAAFDVGSGDGRFAFLTGFGNDPTFDVLPSDREANLLAGAIVEHEIESGTELSAMLSLAVVTCACGNLRQPASNDQLISIARRRLAEAQGNGVPSLKNRTYLTQPETMTSAVAAVGSTPTQYNGVAPATAAPAMQELGKYSEAISAASARSDQEIINYVRKLEQEMQTYWWVTGGWCDQVDRPYSSLPIATAAIHSGSELAEKHSSEVGLFAAPALLNLVLERGRVDQLVTVSLVEAATATDIDWRKKWFAGPAAGPLAPLTPVSTALGLAAESGDEVDWKPRFARATGISPDATLPAFDLGVQLYRERLLTRAWGSDG